MTSVSDVKFGTLVLRAGGAEWLQFILWLNPKRSLDRKHLFRVCFLCRFLVSAGSFPRYEF